MKKSLLLITSLVLSCIVLAGCADTNMAITTSKDLNKNLTMLSNTVNRLDTVDNAYLINEDLYVMDSLSADQTSIKDEKFSNVTRLASSSSVIVDNESLINNDILRDEIKKSLTDEIIDRLYCNENGNCKICKETFVCNDDGVCTNCNQTIICDENGNCSTCKKTLNINDNNSCSNCNTNCTTDNRNNTLSNSIKNRLLKISNNNKELIATKLSNVEISENNENLKVNNLENIDSYNSEVIVNNTDINDNNIVDNTTNSKETEVASQENKIIENEENSEKIDENKNEDNNANQNTEEIDDDKVIRIIYYSNSDFAPENIKYSPRHISTFDYNSASNNIENYINKVQKLYTMTADVVKANNTLGNRKTTILGTIEETKKLNNCIMSGECSPSENQVDALRNYIAEMKNTIQDIRDCNGELTNEINKISSANNGLSQSIDVINSNYLKILNQLDTRISYHENAIATLEQIKYLLEESINTNAPTTNENDSPIIDTIPDNNVENDSDTIDNNTANSEDNVVETEDNVTETENDNILDNPQPEEPSTDTLEDNETIDNNNDTLEENTDTTTADDLDNNNDIVVEEQTETIISTDNNTIEDRDSEVALDNDNNNAENVEETTDETTDVRTNNNIDGYKENTFGSSNIDTLEHKYTNSTDIQKTDVDNNVNNTNVINDNAVNTITNKPTMINSNDSTALYGNTGYANSIINDNNMGEKEIGNSSYRYDENGKLYNNTNGFNTNADYNINNKNNNVNTYKYNTMIDTINRGTVNNGINTL